MNRVFRVAALAVSVLALTSMNAFASYHNLSEGANLSLFGTLVYEVEHYLLHITFTLQGLGYMLTVSPAFGWDYIAGGTACAGASWVASFLFSTSLGSIATTIVTLGAPLFIGYRLIRRYAFPPTWRTA